jgi:uncharacterized protein (TIGR04255 family)
MQKAQAIDFERPPINEVVFGVRFNSTSFLSAHYGIFWERIRKEFPRISDQSPILDPAGMLVERNFMPRMWCESEDQKKLIQLQPDRFHFNWRQTNSDDKYPRFEILLPEFLRVWKDFTDWSKSVSPPFTLSPTLFELSYINHIDERSGWNSPADNHQVLRFLNTAVPSGAICTSSSTQMNYSLSDGKGDMRIGVKQGIRRNDNKPVLVLDLTVSKIIAGDSLEKWFLGARDMINPTFMALTTDAAHKRWGYKGRE